MPSFDPIPVTLRGEHVRLEPLGPEHAPGLLEAGRDRSIWDYMTIPPFERLADAEAFVASARGEEAAGRHLPFATIDARSSRVVGSTRFLDIQRAHRGVEIGFTWITPAAQRTAINTEAKLLMLRHAFEGLGALRVCLKTDRLNERSQRAIERLGAIREGTLRSHMILYSGRVRDTVYFSVLEAEWPLVRDGLLRKLGRTG